MANIGGNIIGVLQTKTSEKNKIGEKIHTWAEAFTVKGWLDLQSGGKDRVNFMTKLEESTHLFLCDYHSGIYALADVDTRMIIKGFVYEVLLIDNPAEMDEHLEIYLKKVGACHG